MHVHSILLHVMISLMALVCKKQRSINMYESVQCRDMIMQKQFKYSKQESIDYKSVRQQ